MPARKAKKKPDDLEASRVKDVLTIDDGEEEQPDSESFEEENGGGNSEASYDEEGDDEGEGTALTSFMYSKPVKEGICAIVYRKDPIQFLLIKNARTGEWSCPSGGIMEGETEVDALHRELIGTVGVSRYLSRPTNLIMEFTYKYTNLPGRQKVYLVEVDQNTNVYAGPGITEITWAGRDQLYQFIKYQELRRVLENLAL